MKIKEWKKEADKSKSNKCSVESMPSRDQNLYLVYKDEKAETRLNSTYRPIEEAIRWASQYNITKKRSVIYMFGLGNGYFVRELIKRLLPDSTLIIMEPSCDIFSHVARCYDLSDIFDDNRIKLFMGERGERDFYMSLEQYVHWTNLISQIFCIHPGYDKLFQEKLIRYEEMIRQNNEKEIRNRNTEAHFGKRRVENIIKNLRYTPDSIILGDVAGKLPKDIPAIIVAAGPSLDKNAEMLKMAAGKSFIICCDTALKHLHKRGFVPDAAITVDAGKPERYFDDAGFEELPVITTATANYKVLSKNKGLKIWFSGHEFQIKLYEKLGKQLSYRTGGGSVATAAFAVCASLGFKTIILVGQDLAYEGEVSHAGGVHSRIRNEEEGITYVKGIDGTNVRTRRDWVSFLQWYETMIISYHDEFEVIDATEGGAFINGSKVMTLAKAIEYYCRNNYRFSQILGGIRLMNNHKVFQEYMNNIPHMTDELILLCGKSLEAAKKGLFEIEYKNNEAIDKINQQLKSYNKMIQMNDIYCLADEYARNETMEHVQELVAITDDKAYYSSVIKIQEELLKAAKKIKELIEA